MDLPGLGLPEQVVDEDHAVAGICRAVEDLRTVIAEAVVLPELVRIDHYVFVGSDRDVVTGPVLRLVVGQRPVKSDNYDIHAGLELRFVDIGFKLALLLRSQHIRLVKYPRH